MRISGKEYLIAVVFSISMATVLIATSGYIDNTQANNTQNKEINPSKMQDLSELKKYVNVNNIPEDIKREISR